MLNLFRLIFAPPRDLILVLLAGWLGLALADRRARQSVIGEKGLDALAFSMLIAFAAGGRLLFLAAHWAAFVADPASLFSVNRDAFDVWGGVACAVIAGAVVLQRKQMPAWSALDLLAPMLAALGVGLGLSHLASGAAFGRPARLPWSIELWGAARHPTQIYEVITGLVVLALIWFWQTTLRPGSRFLLWLALAAGSRLIIEGFRGDSTLVFGGLRLAQIVAWLVLAGALLILELRQSRREPRAEPPPASPSG